MRRVRLLIAASACCLAWSCAGSSTGITTASSSSGGSPGGAAGSSSAAAGSSATAGSGSGGASSSAAGSSGAASTSSTSGSAASSSSAATAATSSASAAAASSTGGGSAAGSSSSAAASTASGSSTTSGSSSSPAASSSGGADAGNPCVDAPATLAALQACFDATGSACTDDGRPSSGAVRVMTWSNGPQRVEITSDGTATYTGSTGVCFRERRTASGLELVDGRGCAVTVPAPDGGRAVRVADGFACTVLIPPPARCLDTGTTAADWCEPAVPVCCRQPGDTDRVLDCLPSGLCELVGGTVVGWLGGAPDAGAPPPPDDTTFNGGTADVCVGGTPLAVPGMLTAMLPAVADGGPTSRFNLPRYLGCGGSAGPDAMFKVHVEAGVPVRVRAIPLSPDLDLALVALNDCPVPAPDGGRTACDITGEDGTRGEAEEIILLRAASADVLVLVDTRAVGQSGAFTISADVASLCGKPPFQSERCTADGGATVEVESNNAWFVATPYGGGRRAFVSPQANSGYEDDYFSWLVTAPVSVIPQVTATGACVGSLDELEFLDGRRQRIVYYSNPGTLCSAPPTVALPVGRTWVRLQDYNAAPYRLELREARYSAGTASACAAAPQVVVPGDGGVVTVPLTGMEPGSFNLADRSPCRGSLGADAVLAIVPTAGDVYRVTATPAGNSNEDIALSVTADCPATACLAGADRGGDGQGETTTFVAATSNVHYVVVDGAHDTARSDFSVTVQRLLPECGNGIVEVPEQCDPGLQGPLAGCSATCRYERVTEAEPNDSKITAQVIAPFEFAGGVIGSDQDWVAFDLTAPATTLLLETGTPDLASCVPAANDKDTAIALFNAVSTSSLASNDDASGYCSRIDGNSVSGARNLPPGRYYVRVSTYGNPYSAPNYVLYIMLQ